MRDKRLMEKLELRRLDAICVRQEAQIGLMRHAINAVAEAYRAGELGHQHIGELLATTQHNGGHQMMALLSRLMMLFKACVACHEAGDYAKLPEALAEVSAALEEGFYE